MTENTNPELTVQDEIDLGLLGGGTEEAPTSHSLLQVWQEVLSNVEGAKAERVAPQSANRLVSSWPKMSYADTVVYHEMYHDLLIELRDILTEEIESDPDCFKYGGEEDAEENREHYLELLFAWQARIQEWEHAWDARDENAAAWIAAIADATAFFVGPNGLVQHLETIKFEFDEEAQLALRDRLTEAKKELS